MLMMGKEYYLGPFCEIAEDLETGGCSVVVEIDEEVVGNEGKRRAVVQGILDRGHSQREIELVCRASAHPRYGNGQSVRPHADEMHLVVLVKLGAQFLERTSGQRREDRSRSFQQRSLFFKPVTLDCP